MDKELKAFADRLFKDRPKSLYWLIASLVAEECLTYVDWAASYAYESKALTWSASKARETPSSLAHPADALTELVQITGKQDTFAKRWCDAKQTQLKTADITVRYLQKFPGTYAHSTCLVKTFVPVLNATLALASDSSMSYQVPMEYNTSDAEWAKKREETNNSIEDAKTGIFVNLPFNNKKTSVHTTVNARILPPMSTSEVQALEHLDIVKTQLDGLNPRTAEMEKLIDDLNISRVQCFLISEAWSKWLQFRPFSTTPIESKQIGPHKVLLHDLPVISATERAIASSATISDYVHGICASGFFCLPPTPERPWTHTLAEHPARGVCMVQGWLHAVRYAFFADQKVPSPKTWVDWYLRYLVHPTAFLTLTCIQEAKDKTDEMVDFWACLLRKMKFVLLPAHTTRLSGWSETIELAWNTLLDWNPLQFEYKNAVDIRGYFAESWRFRDQQDSSDINATKCAQMAFALTPSVDTKTDQTDLVDYLKRVHAWADSIGRFITHDGNLFLSSVLLEWLQLMLENICVLLARVNRTPYFVTHAREIVRLIGSIYAEVDNVILDGPEMDNVFSEKAFMTEQDLIAQNIVWMSSARVMDLFLIIVTVHVYTGWVHQTSLTYAHTAFLETRNHPPFPNVRGQVIADQPIFRRVPEEANVSKARLSRYMSHWLAWLPIECDATEPANVAFSMHGLYTFLLRNGLVQHNEADEEETFDNAPFVQTEEDPDNKFVLLWDIVVNDTRDGEQREVEGTLVFPDPDDYSSAVLSQLHLMHKHSNHRIETCMRIPDAGAILSFCICFNQYWRSKGQTSFSTPSGSTPLRFVASRLTNTDNDEEADARPHFLTAFDSKERKLWVNDHHMAGNGGMTGGDQDFPDGIQLRAFDDSMSFNTRPIRLSWLSDVHYQTSPGVQIDFNLLFCQLAAEDSGLLGVKPRAAVSPIVTFEAAPHASSSSSSALYHEFKEDQKDAAHLLSVGTLTCVTGGRAAVLERSKQKSAWHACTYLVERKTDARAGLACGLLLLRLAHTNTTHFLQGVQVTTREFGTLCSQWAATFAPLCDAEWASKMESASLVQTEQWTLTTVFKVFRACMLVPLESKAENVANDLRKWQVWFVGANVNRVLDKDNSFAWASRQIGLFLWRVLVDLHVPSERLSLMAEHSSTLIEKLFVALVQPADGKTQEVVIMPKEFGDSTVFVSPVRHRHASLLDVKMTRVFDTKETLSRLAPEITRALVAHHYDIFEPSIARSEGRAFGSSRTPKMLCNLFFCLQDEKQDVRIFCKAEQIERKAVWTELLKNLPRNLVHQHTADFILGRLKHFHIRYRIHRDSLACRTFVDVWHKQSLRLDVTRVMQFVFEETCTSPRDVDMPTYPTLTLFDDVTDQVKEVYSLEYLVNGRTEASSPLEWTVMRTWCSSIVTAFTLPLKHIREETPAVLIVGYGLSQTDLLSIKREGSYFFRGAADFVNNLLENDPISWGDAVIHPCVVLPLSKQSNGQLADFSTQDVTRHSPTVQGLMWFCLHSLLSNYTHLAFQLFPIVDRLWNQISKPTETTKLIDAIRSAYKTTSVPYALLLRAPTMPMRKGDIDILFDDWNGHLIEPGLFAETWYKQPRIITFDTSAQPLSIAASMRLLTSQTFGHIINMAVDTKWFTFAAYRNWSNAFVHQPAEFRRNWHLNTWGDAAFRLPTTVSCRAADALFEIVSGLLIQSAQKSAVDAMEDHFLDPRLYDQESKGRKRKEREPSVSTEIEWPKVVPSFMGSGKSRVMIPLLVLRLLMANHPTWKEKHTVLIVLPSHLTKAMFGRLCMIISTVLPRYPVYLADETVTWAALSTYARMDSDGKPFARRVIVISDKDLQRAFVTERLEVRNSLTRCFVIMDEIDLMYNPLTSEFNLVHKEDEYHDHPITTDLVIKKAMEEFKIISPYWYENLMCLLAFGNVSVLANQRWPEEETKGVERVNSLFRLLDAKVALRLEAHPVWRRFTARLHRVVRTASLKLQVNHRCGLADPSHGQFLAVPFSNGKPVLTAKFSDPDISVFLTCLSYATLLKKQLLFPRKEDMERVELFRKYNHKMSPCAILTTEMDSDGKTTSPVSFHSVLSKSNGKMDANTLAQWYVIHLVLRPFMMYQRAHDSVPFLFVMLPPNGTTHTLGMTGTSGGIPFLDNVTEQQKLRQTMGDVVRHSEVLFEKLQHLPRMLQNALQRSDKLYSIFVDAGAMFRHIPQDRVIHTLSTYCGGAKVLYFDLKTDELRIYYPSDVESQPWSATEQSMRVLEYKAQPTDRYLLYYDFAHIVGTDVPFQPKKDMNVICSVDAQATRLTELSQASFRARHLLVEPQKGEKRVTIDYLVFNADLRVPSYVKMLGNVEAYDMMLKDETQRLDDLSLVVHLNLSLTPDQRRGILLSLLQEREDAYHKDVLAMDKKHKTRFLDITRQTKGQAFPSSLLRAELKYEPLSLLSSSKEVQEEDLLRSSTSTSLAIQVSDQEMIAEAISSARSRLNLRAMSWKENFFPYLATYFDTHRLPAHLTQTLQEVTLQFARISPLIWWQFFFSDELIPSLRRVNDFLHTHPNFYLGKYDNTAGGAHHLCAWSEAMLIGERKTQVFAAPAAPLSLRWSLVWDVQYGHETHESLFTRFLVRIPFKDDVTIQSLVTWLQDARNKAGLEILDGPLRTKWNQIQCALDFTRELFKHDKKTQLLMQPEILEQVVIPAVPRPTPSEIMQLLMPAFLDQTQRQVMPTGSIGR